jgi:hypothetical protein
MANAMNNPGNHLNDLTVGELIELLECYPDDAVVRIAHDSGLARSAERIVNIAVLKGGPRKLYNWTDESDVVWIATTRVDRTAEDTHAPVQAWDHKYSL